MTPEILSLLREGPATTGEISALLGRTSNSGVGVILADLVRQGRVMRTRVDRTHEVRGPRMTSLWSINENTPDPLAGFTAEQLAEAEQTQERG